MAFELPKLNYAFEALEPNIDAKTMEIHYVKLQMNLDHTEKIM